MQTKNNTDTNVPAPVKKTDALPAKPSKNSTSVFQQPDHIFFKVKNRLERIRFESVLWIEARDIYSIIRTDQARYLVSHTLKSLEERLPTENFARIHRSYIVQVNKIDAIEDNAAVIDENYIPIGKTFKESLLSRLNVM